MHFKIIPEKTDEQMMPNSDFNNFYLRINFTVV